MDKKWKYFSGTTFGVALVFCLMGSILIGNVQQRNRHEKLYMLMQTQARQMQENVQTACEPLFSLRALVFGAGGNADLEAYGPYLAEDASCLRNLLLAPDGVVSQVYPLDGNEGALGLDLYSENNASSAEALLAAQSEEVVLTPPYELVQGGKAISGRLSVWLPQPDGTKKNWGLVSVSLRFPDVLRAGETDQLAGQGYAYRVSLIGEKTDKDPGGEEAETTERILMQSHYAGGHSPETLSFSIESMNLRLEAYPESGWIDYATVGVGILLSVVAALFISFLTNYFGANRRDLKKQATRDPLTGLYNRAAGARKIEKILSEDAFSRGMFLLLDIDHFKEVNDTLGHIAGDRVLIEVAHTLQAACRRDDVICRLGGDEFVLFMRFDEGREPLESMLRQLLIELDHTVEGRDKTKTKTVQLSASVGVAFAPADGTGFEALYQAADGAMYRAKTLGRNRFAYSCGPAPEAESIL